MNNVFSVSPLTNGQVYRENDIIKYDGNFIGLPVTGAYLYCVAEHLHTTTGILAPNSWEGITNLNGSAYPKFLWSPDWNSSVDSEPRVRKVTLGDGYEIRMNNGINNLLIEYNLSFDNRDITEITAIEHFLRTRAGAQAFVFEGRPPLIASKLFVCERWSNIEKFENNYSINCQFREVAN